jgi:hypothetical protein
MLTGPEQLEWTEAFFRAFAEQEFSDLLLHRLDDRIGEYATQQTPPKTAIGAVVDAYSRRDWEDRLITKAIESRPSNAALLRLARRQKAAVAPDDTHLERLIRDTSSFLDIATWLDKAGKLQVCVCRIEISTQGGRRVFGTGFLIAADLIMTNFHVMHPVVAVENNNISYNGPRAKATDVVCRFDYKVLASGATSEGSAFKLAKEWRVALSPNDPGTRPPTADELDFAIIRLAQPAGTLPVGNKPTAPGDLRGWIALPAADVRPDFTPHSSLFIIQHPKAEPLKLALESDAIQSIDQGRTRVRYSTNTEPGSSGSPCFDQNWNLIALHHSGDPEFTPTYNEGIPIDAIIGYLTRQGMTGVMALGDQ